MYAKVPPQMTLDVAQNNIFEPQLPSDFKLYGCSVSLSPEI